MAECLKNENVQIAFGYPGAAICPFLDYLYRSPIKNVLVREEQNAAHGDFRRVLVGYRQVHSRF